MPSTDIYDNGDNGGKTEVGLETARRRSPKAEDDGARVKLKKVDYDARDEEMAALFGSRSGEILEAETEMQLEFDKFSQDAQLWPCLPLNMKFD